MKKAVVFLTLFTLLSKTLGFLRDITLSYFFGASPISDAYLIALTIPDSIFSFVVTGLATGYIPISSRIIEDKKAVNHFTSSLINLLFLICSVIVCICLFLAEPLVRLFAFGFDEETLQLAAKFLRVSIFSIYFTGLITISNGYLQMNNSFILTALAGIPLNSLIILSIAISANHHVVFLALGSVIAVAVQCCMLIPFVIRKGFTYQLVCNNHGGHLKKMVCLSLPIIIGVSVNQINVLIDRTMASYLATGGISALTYAERLNVFIQGTFIITLITVLFPSISKMAADKDYSQFRNLISKAIKNISLLVIPITVLTLVISKPMVLFLFGRGAFDEEAVSLTSSALFFYSMGMLGMGLREVTARAFYALEDTKTPMINACFTVLINILLNILLSRYFGIGGLALSTSIAGTVGSLLLLWKLKKRIGTVGMKDISSTLVQAIAASAAMGFVVKITYEAMRQSMGETFSLLASILIGLFTYVLILFLMRIEKVLSLVKEVKRKLLMNVD